MPYITSISIFIIEGHGRRLLELFALDIYSWTTNEQYGSISSTSPHNHYIPLSYVYFNLDINLFTRSKVSLDDDI